VNIGGTVQYDNQPVQAAVVEVEIYRQGSLFARLPKVTTRSDGSFSDSYTVPVVPDSNWSAHEVWLVLVVASHNQYGSASRELSMQVIPIKGALNVSFSLDKSKLITGEQVNVSGQVLSGNQPVKSAVISADVYRQGSLLEALNPVITQSDGSFSFSYTIPIVPIAGEIAPEEWVIQIWVNDDQYGSASEKSSMQVLPVDIELVDVKLVQVVENPVISGDFVGASYLATGRETGVRALLQCKGWQNGFTKPGVQVSFSHVPIWGGDSCVINKTVELDNDRTPVDFIFTLSSQGTHELKVEVDAHRFRSDELKWEARATAKKMKSMMLRFVPVNTPDSLIDSDLLILCDKQYRFVQDVYPTSNIHMAITKPIEKYIESNVVILNQLGLKNFYGFAGDRVDILVGITPDSYWGLDQDGCFVSAIVSAVLIRSGTTCDSVTGHEVGHTLGCYRWWSEEYDSAGYSPIKKGLILKSGQIYDMAAYEDRKRAFYSDWAQASDVYCMMGNECTREWICRKDYGILLESLRDPANTQSVFVNGWIDSNDTVSLGTWYLIDNTVPDAPFGEGGSYAIRILTDSGEVLYSDYFGDESIEDRPFAFRIPWYPAAAKVEIRKNNQTLASVMPSANAPTVDTLYPLGGENVSGFTTVSWQASDADGDDLVYSVLYSHDGGEDWQAIAINLTDTSIQLDMSRLPGGKRCIFKVVASDGFNTGISESGYFSVTDKKPVCALYADNGMVRGIGYDPEDGLIPDSSLGWTSSVGGNLGSGKAISIGSLTGGSQDITLTVRDSQGHTAQAKTRVSGGRSLSEGKKTDSSCFIATAAYGSETASQLDTFRAFRDNALMKNRPGRWFVSTYYSLSPPVADFIADREELRTVIREAMLNPILTLLTGTRFIWDN